jgi:predicted nuclease of predicted toxin-antitoxin system
MRLLADVNIAPRTVEFLNSQGHDTVRSSSHLPVTAPDEAILELARREQRVVLTQDLDFTHMVALSGENGRRSLRCDLQSRVSNMFTPC